MFTAMIPERCSYKICNPLSHSPTMPGCGSSGVPALPQGRVLVSVPRQQCAAPSCDLHDPAVLHILELALHHQVAILFEVRRKAGRLRAPKPQLTVPPVHPAGTRDEQVPIWVLCDGHIIVLPLCVWKGGWRGVSGSERGGGVLRRYWGTAAGYGDVC